nr:MAG TPA: hypothetical protein [Caudoviricetes sp.]
MVKVHIQQAYKVMKSNVCTNTNVIYSVRLKRHIGTQQRMP